MLTNSKTLITLLIMICITTTIIYGSDKKPNHRNYTAVQKLAALEQGSLSPRYAYAENSPKSRTSIELVVQQPDSPSSLSHEENKSPTMDNPKTIFTEWKKAVLETRCSRPSCLKYSCGTFCIAGVITIVYYAHDIEKALGLT